MENILKSKESNANRHKHVLWSVVMAALNIGVLIMNNHKLGRMCAYQALPSKNIREGHQKNVSLGKKVLNHRWRGEGRG